MFFCEVEVRCLLVFHGVGVLRRSGEEGRIAEVSKKAPF